MINFEILSPSSIPWNEFEKFEDRIMFQDRAWLEFIEDTSDAKTIVISIKNDHETIGCFTGLVFEKYGLKILGSPFNGWATSFMGFNLISGFSRCHLLKQFIVFLFKNVKCNFIQIQDFYLTDEKVKNIGFFIEHWQNFEIDLSRNEETLFSNMDSDCRRRVRKGQKEGLVFETARDVNEFSENYYTQLIQVFSKHALVPTYGKDKVDKLIKHLYPTGNLLLLHAKTPEGVCIATSIILMDRKMAHWWGGASLLAYLHDYSPNEGLMWHGIKQAKDLGAIWFDMGGWAPYKKKYGTVQVTRSSYMISNPKFLVKVKNIAKESWYLWHKIRNFNKVKEFRK